MLNPSTEKFITVHQRCGGNLRLGQMFINRYIRHSWPELYYERDDQKSVAMIDKWLTDNQYHHVLPMPIKALVSLHA